MANDKGETIRVVLSNLITRSPVMSKLSDSFLFHISMKVYCAANNSNKLYWAWMISHLPLGIYYHYYYQFFWYKRANTFRHPWSEEGEETEERRDKNEGKEILPTTQLNKNSDQVSLGILAYCCPRSPSIVHSTMYTDRCYFCSV